MADGRVHAHVGARDPVRDGVVHGLVREHVAAIVECVQERGSRSLPRYVEAEFEAFLRCGVLACAFMRAPCTGCGHDRLVERRRAEVPGTRWTGEDRRVVGIGQGGVQQILAALAGRCPADHGSSVNPSQPVPCRGAPFGRPMHRSFARLHYRRLGREPSTHGATAHAGRTRPAGSTAVAP